MAATRHPSPLRKAAGICIKVAGGLLLALLLVLAGALVWLRTDSAAALIADSAAKALSGMGLQLTVGSIEGPLPGRLAINGLVLADDAGPLIKAERVALETDLAALLTGSVVIPLARLDKPELIRLPVLPPSDDQEQSPPEQSGGVPALPVDIVLKEIALTGGIIHTAALLSPPALPHAPADAPVDTHAGTAAGTAAETAAPAGSAPEFFTVDLSGSASLRSMDLDLRLAASLADPAKQGLELELGLVSGIERLLGGGQDPAGNKADELSLSLSAGEGPAAGSGTRPAGPVAALLGLPDFPGYGLRITGKGPVSDWKGTLSLALGSSGPGADSRPAGAAAPAEGNAAFAPQNALLLAEASFGLQCATGSFWHDLAAERNFGASLAASLSPGDKTPAPLLPVLGKALDLTAAVRGKDARLEAEVSVDGPALALALTRVSLSPYEQGGDSPLRGAARGDGSPVQGGTALAASLSARAKDIPALLGLGALGAASGDGPNAPGGTSAAALAPPQSFPVSGVDFSAELTALLDADFALATAEGRLNAQADEENFGLEYSLSLANEARTLSLRSLGLNGLGLRAEARAEADTENMAVSAKAEITAADNAPWQDLAARLAGLGAVKDQEPPLGGSAQLSLALDFPGLPHKAAHEQAAPNTPEKRAATAPASPAPVFSGPATGLLVLRAENMRWPTPELAAMLGPTIDARLRLDGEKPDQTGLPSEYLLRLDHAAAGIFSATGQAGFALPQDAADLLASTLDASFSAKVSDIEALAGEGSSGPLSLRAEARGPLNALDLALEAASPGVTTGTGAFKGISLSLKGKNLLDDAALRFDGDLKAALADSPGGPVSLGGGIQAQVPVQTPAQSPAQTDRQPEGAQGAAPQAEPLKAGIHGFSLQGAGLALRTDLTFTLPPATGAGPAAPELTGTLQARVEDWKRLAALSGAPLSGDPASLDLRLDNAAGRQSASLNASLPRLLLKEPDQPATLRLADVTASLAASDLFGAPSLNLALNTGRGKAAFLNWNKGEASVKGSGGSGEFSLSLRQEGGRRARASNVNPERLGLGGRYDLSGPSVQLSRFALREPRSRTGLELSKPARLDLANGIVLDDLDLAFQPGGRLRAGASVTPEAMTARLDLAELPFAFFALFTQASLPDGTLSAKADIRTGAGGPQGVFSVDSLLSATADLTGISKSGQSAQAGGGSGVSGASGVSRTPGGSGASGTAGKAAPNKAGASALALHIDGKLGSDPGPTVIGGSGVRSLPGRVWLRGDGNFGAASKAGANREGSLAFQIPLLVGANGVPAPDSASPMAAGVRFSGPASVLWQAVPVPDRYLNGELQLEAGVFGPMASPKNRVRAYLAGGRFEDVVNGLLISGINLEAKNNEQGDINALLAADDGRSGKFALQADVTGLQGGTPNLKIRGQLKEFRPLHRDDLDIVLTGILGVNGPADSVTVTGTIAVEQGEVMLARLAGGSVPTLEVRDRYAWSEGESRETEKAVQKKDTEQEEQEEPVAAGPELDIKVQIPQYFFIRGMGLESEWQGELSVTGAASQPSLRGSLRPVRGYLDIFSRTFTFSDGDIAFAGGKEINPALGLELTYEGPDVTAFIRTSGTAKAPKLSLESRPPLPQDEILARVLFGKRTSELSRFEAIQLANNMRELTGFGGSGMDMLTGVRKQIGLDMLRIGGSSGPAQRTTSGQSGEGNLTGASENGESDAGAPTLEAGKYINDSIYVGVEQGATEDSTAVRVEVELFPSITLQGKSSTDTSEVGVGWKMDY